MTCVIFARNCDHQNLECAGDNPACRQAGLNRGSHLVFCDQVFADGVFVAHGGVDVVLVVDGDVEGDFVEDARPSGPPIN
jgi:hypothetical protein